MVRERTRRRDLCAGYAHGPKRIETDGRQRWVSIADCFRKICSRVGVLQVRLQVKSLVWVPCGVIESTGDDIFFTFSPLFLQLRFIRSCLCFPHIQSIQDGLLLG